MNDTNTAAAAEVSAVPSHRFELAGMGRAPFRFIGYSKALYQACPGAPVQAGATCDYCGTAIINVYRIVSSDGVSSKVGCDCIFKVGDAGLVVAVKEAKRTMSAAVRAERKASRAAVRAATADAANATARAAFLAANPGLAEALETDHPIVQDIASKFRRELSAAQVRLVLNLAKRRAAEQAERLVPAPIVPGRQTFRGVVVGTKVQVPIWGPSTYRITVKMTTADGGTWLAWGTCPAKVLDGAPAGLSSLRGAEVEITAALKPGRDAHFALMGRPHGKLIKLAPAE